ncbi:hypothetical protein [Calidifontibacter indicus]|uniref:hypothetical protein n=1 Tax=Calidifontibacter indicus TaxID=419650 RepID=UPI003D740940
MPGVPAGRQRTSSADAESRLMLKASRTAIAIGRHTRPATSFWIEVSQKDKLSGPPSAMFVKTARPATSVTSVTLPHAGHRMEVWGGLIPQCLDWLAHTVPAFAHAA